MIDLLWRAGAGLERETVVYPPVVRRFRRRRPRATVITDGAIGELRERLAGRFQRDVLINSVVGGRRQEEQDEYADRLGIALGEVGWTTTSIVSVGAGRRTRSC